MRDRIRVLVEGGILLGLAIVLTFLPLFEMPQGGSVSLGTLPILIFALRRGGTKGILLGILYGVLHFILGTKFTAQPLSILMDYVIPGAALGLIGYGKAYLTYFAAWGVRYLSYVLSGIIIWGAYAVGDSVVLYSMGYNAAYMIPEMAIVGILLLLIYRFMPKVVKRVGKYDIIRENDRRSE